MTASIEAERDLVIPHCIVELLRSKVAARQALIEERRELASSPEWVAHSWEQYQAIRQREDAATLELASFAQVLMEQHDQTAGRPA